MRPNYCTDGAALFHFVCLDMNGEERNQLVVNAGGTRPHLLCFLSIHVSFLWHFFWQAA